MLFLMNFKSSEETYYYKKSIDKYFNAGNKIYFQKSIFKTENQIFFHIISSQEYGQLSSVVR